jgi:hypothetical protein
MITAFDRRRRPYQPYPTTTNIWLALQLQLLMAD